MEKTNEELVEEYQKTKSQDCFNKLLDQTKGLVKRLASSFCGPNDFEDFQQEGFIALESAARKFDPGKSEKFSTLATITITHRMIRYRKTTVPNVVIIPFENAMSTAYYDKPAGRFDDLDYALSKIPKGQKARIMKVYFSKESHTRSEVTLAGCGINRMRQILN